MSLADGKSYPCRGSFRFSYLTTNWSFNIWEYLKSDHFYSSTRILLEVLNLQASVLENVHLRDVVWAENCENGQDKRGQTTEISFCSGLWKVKGCNRKVTARSGSTCSRENCTEEFVWKCKNIGEQWVSFAVVKFKTRLPIFWHIC